MRAAALCFVAGLISALVVIPPWQQPDEPQHVQTARLIAWYGADLVGSGEAPERGERDIIASMAKARWWEHYGDQTPDVLPRAFAEGPSRLADHYGGGQVGGSLLYHRGIAAILRATGRTDAGDVLPALYMMRVVSALAAVVSLWFVWTGTRLLLDERAALVATSFVALHPQFILVSTTASPDALVNLAGAVFWWRSAALISESTVRNIAWLWFAVVAAVLIRRMGAPLAIVAILVTVPSVFRLLKSGDATEAPSNLRAAALVAVLLSGGLWYFAPELQRAWEWGRLDLADALNTFVRHRLDRVPAFFEMLYTTFWLSAGWLRYPGPAWWHAVTAAVTVIAGGGLVLAWRRGPGVTRAALLAGTMVAVQISSIVVLYLGIFEFGPQGRYLFPVLPAVACLLWIGWSSVIGGTRRQSLAAVTLIAIMAFLNLTAWTVVLLPAYA